MRQNDILYLFQIQVKDYLNDYIWVSPSGNLYLMGSERPLDLCSSNTSTYVWPLGRPRHSVKKADKSAHFFVGLQDRKAFMSYKH